jgi:hypothetical protein
LRVVTKPHGRDSRIVGSEAQALVRMAAPVQEQVGLKRRHRVPTAPACLIGDTLRQVAFSLR